MAALKAKTRAEMQQNRCCIRRNSREIAINTSNKVLQQKMLHMLRNNCNGASGLGLMQDGPEIKQSSIFNRNAFEVKSILLAYSLEFFLLTLHMLGFTFAAVYQLAFPRRRMEQRNRGEDLSKWRESGFYKFFGIGGAHGLKPQAKHKGCQSAPGWLMFHDQHDAVLANHPFHFVQRPGSIPSFEFV